jgi:hypothetical protein
MPFSESAKSLGIVLDQHMKMDKHVAAVCRSASFYLRILGRLRATISKANMEVLIHAFITSRLDYANSLLAGANQKLVMRLQRLQNSAARIVCRLRKFEHISSAMQDLHWLPVRDRIRFKVALLTYRCVHGIADPSLAGLLSPYVPPRQLRSSDLSLLTIPWVSSENGKRAFAVYAPNLWNSLPNEIRSAETLSQFKNLLKTLLFTEAYSL